MRLQTIIKHNLIVLNKTDEKLSVWDAIEDQYRRLGNIPFNKTNILTSLEQSKKRKSCSKFVANGSFDKNVVEDF